MDDARVPVIVTLHAIRRYRERVEPVPAGVVVARLSGPAFDVCNRLGGGAVILPSGHRAVCGDGAIITVLPLGRRFFGYVGKHHR